MVEGMKGCQCQVSLVEAVGCEVIGEPLEEAVRRRACDKGPLPARSLGRLW